MPIRFVFTFLLLASVGLTGCNLAPFEATPIGGYAPVPVVGVQMHSTAVVLAPGDELQVLAIPVYGEYNDRWERPFPPVSFEWTSSDPSILEAGANGRLRAHRSGRVVVTARGAGHHDTATVVVRAAPEPTGATFTRISVGGLHACGLDAAGGISCWGSNSLGAVGAGDPRESVNYLAPVRTRGSTSFRDVAAGSAISCGLAVDGAAHCWGGEVAQRQPTPVAGAQGFVQLTTTAFTACGRTDAGQVFCWGRGFGVTPRPIALPQPVLSIDGHCGLTEAGAALCWSAEPGVETLTAASPLVQISSGFLSTCALDAAGRAFCWGLNESGELGTGAPTDSCRLPYMPAFGCHREPTPVLGGLTFSSLAVGNRFACGVAEGGRAYCWGFNLHGQLGNGGFARSDLPVAVAADLSFSSIAAHESRACGVTIEGEGYCWGNAFLGDGRTGAVPPDRTTGTPRPTRVQRPL
jgi:hypothetical protein